jgi:hypothetical protein
LSIVSPSSAATGSYAITLAASDVADVSHTVTTSATYVVAGPFDVGVSTNQTTYSFNQTARITTSVRSNGSPVAGATVSVRILRPNGSLASLSATTGTDGTAVVAYRFKRQDPRGTYEADTKVTQGSLTGTAATAFALQ